MSAAAAGAAGSLSLAAASAGSLLAQQQQQQRQQQQHQPYRLGLGKMKLGMLSHKHSQKRLMDRSSTRLLSHQDEHEHMDQDGKNLMLELIVKVRIVKS